MAGPAAERAGDEADLDRVRSEPRTVETREAPRCDPLRGRAAARSPQSAPSPSRRQGSSGRERERPRRRRRASSRRVAARDAPGESPRPGPRPARSAPGAGTRRSGGPGSAPPGAGRRSNARASRAAGAPPCWAFGSHGPLASSVATYRPSRSSNTGWADIARTLAPAVGDLRPSHPISGSRRPAGAPIYMSKSGLKYFSALNLRMSPPARRPSSRTRGRRLGQHEYGFTLTEHDPSKPWLGPGQEHRTVALDDGVLLCLRARALARATADGRAGPVATRPQGCCGRATLTGALLALPLLARR